MLKFVFVLIFIFYIFNYIIQGNAVETKNLNSENLDEPQKSKNVQDFENPQSNSQSISIDPSAPEKGMRTDLSADKNAAFTIVEVYNEKNNSFTHELPIITKEITPGIWSLSFLYSKNTQEIHLCPDISGGNDDTTSNSAYEVSPETESCLFPKRFQSDEPKICTKEPISWLTIEQDILLALSSEDMMKLNCNKNSQQLLVFQYNVCDPLYFLEYGKPASQSEMQAKSPFKFKESYKMYHICYDTVSHETLWTRHQILEPMLVYDPVIPAKNIDHIDLDTINTSTFRYDFLSNTFDHVKNAYQQLKNSNINPEYLVPMKHMAMQNWKKSTHHLMNTAPLHEKFHQLMQIIDEGLIGAARFLLTYAHLPLQIFTTTKIKLDENRNFEDITWYKFIYREDDRSGALIYLGNIPDSLCTSNLKCNFNQWVKPEANLQEDILNYSGCCEVHRSRIKELFQIEVLMNKILKVNEMVLYANDNNTEMLKDLLTEYEDDTSQQEAQDLPRDGKWNIIYNILGVDFENEESADRSANIYRGNIGRNSHWNFDSSQTSFEDRFIRKRREEQIQKNRKTVFQF